MSVFFMALPFITDRTTRRRLVEELARRCGASRKRAKRIAGFF